MAVLQGRLFSVFLGSMLGDGHLCRSAGPASNTSFQEIHAVDQEEYLRWKMTFWGDLVSSSRHRPKPKPTCQDQFGFATHVLPELNFWHEAFYTRHLHSPGRMPKHFPEEIVPLMTPLALAVWYMDDGCAGHYPSFSCHPSSHAVGQKILTEFGLRSEIQGTYNINVLDAERFLALVTPHMHPTLIYKLQPAVLGRANSIPSVEFCAKAQELSELELCAHFGVGRHSIREKAAALGVPLSGLTQRKADLAHLVEKVPTGHRPRYHLPKEQLQDFLLTGKSVRYMAGRFGVLEKTVLRELTRHDLEYTKEGKRGRNKYPHITKEALTAACAEGLSMMELEVRFEAKRTAIQNRIMEWGISRAPTRP